MLGVESATSIPQIIVWGRRDLRVLAQGAGRVLTHEDLLRQVWARRGKANPKIVRAYVKRLRHQLGDDAARPAWIDRLPHGQARRAGRALTAGLSCGTPSRPERPRVAAGRGLEIRRCRPPLDHRQDETPRERPARAR